MATGCALNGAAWAAGARGASGRIWTASRTRMPDLGSNFNSWRVCASRACLKTRLAKTRLSRLAQATWSLPFRLPQCGGGLAT
eukprot:CAMPEP_0115732278 /NCGR_PEP_ID=MMETSP0272-20121206/85037_1 /TAXON_ID=71861 /ORGANISM="Scrippsiella trochoidea, Strain CCMP3099" /LENGTH=82 /DNA_ID=CAMNT_0003176179 /DNA_START=40 /DNA_END=285 /DNA_ORIENTATION=-